MASQPPASATDPQNEPEEPTDNPVGPRPYSYTSSRVEPCAISKDGRALPFHLLQCGHLVAVDSHDTRCGLNCLHVSTWMTQQLSHQDEESMQLNGGKTLFHSLTYSARRPYRPLRPPQTNTQGHDELFCEICQGIPFSSYNFAHPDHGFRRALGLTRVVLSHFTNFPVGILRWHLCRLFQNPLAMDTEKFHVHHLFCGHEVLHRQRRPCAANCRDMPSCREREFPLNVKQADALLCMECTYRAELVYERYIKAGGGAAQPEVARNGLPASGDDTGHSNTTTMGHHTLPNGSGYDYEDNLSPGDLDLEMKPNQQEQSLESSRSELSGLSDARVQPAKGDANTYNDGDDMDIKMDYD